jgi:TP901 family phage tail tape measure protein
MARAGASAGLLVSAPIVAAVATGISQAVSFETALAGVAKTVDAPKEAIDKLGVKIRDMAKEMPFAREEIAGMSEAVGRFGIDINNIPAVTEMFLKLGAAIPDMNAQTAAEEMVKFFNVMKTPQSEWEPNLSSIVALGNDLPTTEQAIISFAGRLSQIGNFVPNISEADVLGLAGAFSALNIKPQAGGSSISRVFLEMDTAVKTGGETLDTFTKLMGLTNAQFSEAYRQDPAHLFVDFLDAVKAAGDAGAPINDILDSIGLNDIRVRQAILAGSNNTALVRDALNLSNNSMKESSALQTEYDKRVETTASKWTMFKNKLSDATMVMGSAFLPVLLDVMTALEPFVEMLGNVATVFSEMDPGIRKFISIMLALVVTAGPAIFIFSKMIMMIKAMNAAFWILTANPVVLVIMAIALAALLVIHNWSTLKEWFFAFWEWFYTNWDKLWAWFFEKLTLFKAWWSETWESIANWVGEKASIISGHIEWLINLIQSIGDWIGDLPNKFVAAWDWIVRTVRGARDDLFALFAEIGSAADRALGPVDEILGAGFGLVGSAIGQVIGKDNGGIVPGPIGAPRMILAHGGEEVVARHKGKGDGGSRTLTINLNGPIRLNSDEDVLQLRRMIQQQEDMDMLARGGY